MRLAVISDVHGNYKALEAFLEAIEKEAIKKDPIDGIIGLGDYVTDAPYPEKIFAVFHAMAEKYPCYVVRGNREEYLLENEQKDQGWHPSSASGSLYYTANHISREQMQCLKKLPGERILSFPGLPSLTLCHGVPGRSRGNVALEENLLEQALNETETDWLLGGHTHKQQLQRIGGKTYMNPGSLGLCIDHEGCHAQYAVLCGEQGEWRAEFHTIPYDVQGYLQDFKESGLEEYGKILTKAIEKTLLTGRNYFYDCVALAAQLYGGPLFQITEEIWEEAACRLAIDPFFNGKISAE